MCKCAWFKKLFGLKGNCCCQTEKTAPVATPTTPATPATPAAPTAEKTEEQFNNQQ